MTAVRVVAWMGTCVFLLGCGRTSSQTVHDAAPTGDRAVADAVDEAPWGSDGGADSRADPKLDLSTIDALRAAPTDAAADLQGQDVDSSAPPSPDADSPPFDAAEIIDKGADAPMADMADSQPLDPVDGGPGPTLVGAALVAAPTSEGFRLNVVLRSGAPKDVRAHVRLAGLSSWKELGPPTTPAFDVAEWAVVGLSAGQLYQYEVFAAGGSDGGSGRVLASGSAVTQRAPGASFTFDLLTDSHIPPCDSVADGTTVCGDDYLSADETTLLDVSSDIGKDQPDFVIHMGDMLDYHRFGFNEPPPDSAWSRLAYLNYRRLMVDTLTVAAHFPAIGNWEGENGCNSAEAIRRSSSQRMLYVPGPKPDTYPEGGSPSEDYYAFTWGDALFVVLNVMTYTPTCHLLSGPVGLPDDWTLGPAQRAWLENTLAHATSKWRFTFIHHTVGGNAGDDSNSAYGRGGGRAAYVGEQAVIHQMLLKYGVQIFFYGHDHVFTDMVVDGIHYTLPGSAGAPWKFDTSITGYEQYWPDSGHGRVTVSPTQVIVDFAASGGSVLSSYSLN
jgi:hypothetical protein